MKKAAIAAAILVLGGAIGASFFGNVSQVSKAASGAEALELHPDFALTANNLGFVYCKQIK